MRPSVASCIVVERIKSAWNISHTEAAGDGEFVGKKCKLKDYVGGPVNGARATKRYTTSQWHD